MESEGGQTTGTKDKDYNIIEFTEQCLFRRAQAESRKGGERGKHLLTSRVSG